jgi:hypothetical protein
MPIPHFITFKLKDPKKSLQDINPVYVQKALDGIAGKVRNTTLLVKVFNEKQRSSLRQNSSVRISYISRDICLSVHPREL